MNVLVLGGTEFVSAALAQHLIQKGYAVDIFTRGIKPIRYEGFRDHLVGDRTDEDQVADALKGRVYDVVMDISAYAPKDLTPILKTIDRTQLKRYIFCSSGGVYGFGKGLVDETHPRVTGLEINEYCLNKRLCEDVLFEDFERQGLPVVIFRPTYIYGEGNNLRRESYYFDLVDGGQAIIVPTAHENKEQFVHIEDLCKQFESAIHCDAAKGQAFNTTCSEPITWATYAEAILTASLKKTDIIHVDSVADVKAAGAQFPFYDEPYTLSNDKVKQFGLHEPCITLVKGLTRAYASR